jgi:hypothetical protein
MGKAVSRVAAALAAIASTSAAAQHPLVLSKLQELNAKAPQPTAAQLRSAVLATAKAFGEAKGTCVPADVTLGDVAPITGAREVLQAVLSGQARNSWTVYATHGGCPTKEPFRYMVVQKADGTLIAPLVNEGKSFANPSIMRDTSVQVALAAVQKARSLDAGCTGEKMEMGPTKIVSQSADLGPEVFGARYVGSWVEAWQFTTCGRSFSVPIEFRADGDGGAYTNVRAEEVALVL